MIGHVKQGLNYFNGLIVFHYSLVSPSSSNVSIEDPVSLKTLDSRLRGNDELCCLYQRIFRLLNSADMNFAKIVELGYLNLTEPDQLQQSEKSHDQCFPAGRGGK